MRRKLIRPRVLYVHQLELPRIHYERVNVRAYRYCYGLSHADGSAAAALHTRLVKLDVASGEAAVWSEAGCHPSEPVFVSAPEAAAEDEGVVLSVVLDLPKQRSSLLVLEAGGKSEVARATDDALLPLGLHGAFLLSSGTLTTVEGRLFGRHALRALC